MSQHHNQPVIPTASTVFVFPPIPLASGDTVYDRNGEKHRVVAVTVRIGTEDSDTPIEVDLESRFGGWWVPTP
ncbi:hypothetical protein [Nocardioides sp. LS1]|uniref:hypothetical protein n=1 Tax=Nocardioides sp. LS1 TaxID=1027620 RepID=UPI000F623A44|nr:hypothetical protein [Nocardioides sp. LS1]GCD90130.1 hypothetical protein NLS1_21360 [Nocardioides sp. LS1]